MKLAQKSPERHSSANRSVGVSVSPVSDLVGATITQHFQTPVVADGSYVNAPSYFSANVTSSYASATNFTLPPFNLTSLSNISEKTPSSRPQVSSPSISSSFPPGLIQKQYWEYIDSYQQIQGPFSSQALQDWYEKDLLENDLMVRKFGSLKFQKIKELERYSTYVKGNVFGGTPSQSQFNNSPHHARSSPHFVSSSDIPSTGLAEFTPHTCVENIPTHNPLTMRMWSVSAKPEFEKYSFEVRSLLLPILLFFVI